MSLVCFSIEAKKDSKNPLLSLCHCVPKRSVLLLLLKPASWTFKKNDAVKERSSLIATLKYIYSRMPFQSKANVNLKKIQETKRCVNRHGNLKEEKWDSQQKNGPNSWRGKSREVTFLYLDVLDICILSYIFKKHT